MYARLFSYARYLNQKGLDPTYTDYFGKSHTVTLREDIQLNKFFLPFAGWFLTPKFRYYLYVWSSNPSQGDPAQVVGAGNLSWTFNRYVTLGGGITSLPSVRSTEGQFPYWLGIDDRLTSDEFFRGSYTTGVWLKGELFTKFKYMAMLANNLSTLGVSASQLDNTLNTSSFMLQWLPTTGEFGLYGTFGDYDCHEKLATRVAGHYTHSREDKQSQPGTNGIENSQIRLTDGSVIFTPDLFGPGITVEKVNYDMTSVDAGIKYKGMSLEAEYYWRQLGTYAGPNTQGIAEIHDHGFQVQSSAMVVPKTVQVYLSGAGIFGRYGDSSEVRAGANWYVGKTAGAPRQRGVDPPEQESGGLHRRAVSGGRQRQRLPRELRDELLRRDTSMRWRTALRFGWAAAAGVAIVFGWLLVATPSARQGPRQAPAAAAPSDPGYLLHDSHLHLTNYIQEGPDIRDFLKVMGTKVGRVAIFGLPLQQMWDHGNTGDFAPTYYLQSDAPLYYYSFTDAFIAMQYRSLTPAEQARFDPMITGFNPADMYAADHIKRVLLTFPGVFSGIGEFTIHKEFVSSKIAGKTASLLDPALDRILDFAGEVGLVAILHNDIDMPFPKPGQEPWIVPQFRDLLLRHPNDERHLGARRRRAHRPPGQGPVGDDGARPGQPEARELLHRHLVERDGEVRGRDARDDGGDGGPDQPLPGPVPVRHRRSGADRSGEVPEHLRHLPAPVREADAGRAAEAPQGQLRAAVRRGAAQGEGVGEGAREADRG